MTNETEIRKYLLVLKTARKLLKRGWIRQAYGVREDGFRAKYPCEAKCFCAIGAIRAAGAKVDNQDIWTNRLGLDTESFVGPIFRNSSFDNELAWGDLMLWNDQKDRTQEEVIACFDYLINETEKRIGVCA